MKIKKTIFILIILLCSYRSAFAAEIYLDVPKIANTGETFEVLVNIDTSGATINSLRATLDYDEERVLFSGYQTENTVVDMWVDAPREQDGQVIFSGIIPGGASGLYDPNESALSALPVARLLFMARESGEAKFTFSESEILQHDGQGTPLVHENKESSISISGSPFAGASSSIDKESPESFEIMYLESGFFSRTPPMLIFSATDNGSGIREYGMRALGPGFHKVESPAPIGRGLFPKNITIRAFDYNDNYKDASITIPGLLSFRALAVISALALFALCLVALKMLKYRT